MWQCPKCQRQFKRIGQHHFCEAPSAIDDYIAEQDPAVRPLLEEVRRCVRAAAPGASERISWRMPTFWQGENLVHFAAFKKHLGFFPGDLSEVPFPERLEGHQASKGTIHFPYDRPVDFALIADLTRWRVEQATAKRPR